MRTDKAFIQRAVFINVLLVIYFSCSNLSSFVGILCGAAIFATAGISSLLCQAQKKQENQKSQCAWTSNPQFLQKKFNEFLNASLGKRKFVLSSEILTLISLYIITKISWYVPTWLLLFVISETYVFWDLLKEHAICSKIDGLVQLCKESIERLVNLIPRYEPQANN